MRVILDQKSFYFTGSVVCYFLILFFPELHMVLQICCDNIFLLSFR